MNFSINISRKNLNLFTIFYHKFFKKSFSYQNLNFIIFLYNYKMSKESRFSSSKKNFKHHEEEIPTRLQSIIFPRPELLSPMKKKFLPNTSNVRVPKLTVRRKSSELASERPRSSSISEIQHSLSSIVLISHQPQDPRTVISRKFKKPPAKVAFGLSTEEKVIKNIEDTQKKERTENS